MIVFLVDADNLSSPDWVNEALEILEASEGTHRSPARVWQRRKSQGLGRDAENLGHPSFRQSLAVEKHHGHRLGIRRHGVRLSDARAFHDRHWVRRRRLCAPGRSASRTGDQSRLRIGTQQDGQRSGLCLRQGPICGQSKGRLHGLHDGRRWASVSGRTKVGDTTTAKTHSWRSWWSPTPCPSPPRPGR